MNKCDFSPNRLSQQLERKRKLSAWLLILALLPYAITPCGLMANPSGGAVAQGTATISGGAGNLFINQSSDRAVINWQNFSIQQGELTQFIQPNSSSATLSRVTGGDPSSIYGTLSANGQIFLVNPNGILVGPAGVINAQSFVASTLDVGDAEFMAGGAMRFTGASGAKVENLGTINALGGNVFLIGKDVSNAGTINAASGTVGLAGGTDILFTPAGAGGSKLAVAIASGDGTVTNSGTITAVNAELKAAGGNPYALAINNTGIVKATGVAHEGGKIYLKANKGIVANSGTLDASGASRGGTVQIETKGSISQSGVISVSGADQGGAVTMVAEASAAEEPGAITLMGETRADGALGGLLSFRTDAFIMGGIASASGTQQGGSIDIVAPRAATLFSSAQLLAQGGGSISLGGGGAVLSSGTIDASHATGQGGTIEVTGESVALVAASLDASGQTGGGVIHVGGEWQGSGDLAHADQVLVSPGTTLDASAKESGDGGEIVVWGDTSNLFYGNASATGGSVSGDAGRIEISGGDLTYAGRISLAAPHGVAGSLLLDPKNITIDDAAATGAQAIIDLIPTYVRGANSYWGNGGGLNSTFVTVLPNGDIIYGHAYDDTKVTDGGAVYLFNGTSGAVRGALYGNITNQYVGYAAVTTLKYGDHVHGGTNDYLVASPYWQETTGGSSTYTGAFTLVDGTTGMAKSGADKSLVATDNSILIPRKSANSSQSSYSNATVTELENGNYVICLPMALSSASLTSGAGVPEMGAVLLVNGATGKAKINDSWVVSTSNSIHGYWDPSSYGYRVGSGGITALPYHATSNPNYAYVINSIDTSLNSFTFYNGGASWGTPYRTGAITLADGTTGKPVASQGSTSDLRIYVEGSGGTYTNSIRSVIYNSNNFAIANGGGIQTFGAGVDGFLIVSNSLGGYSTVSNSQDTIYKWMGNLAVAKISTGKLLDDTFLVKGPNTGQGDATSPNSVWGDGSVGSGNVGKFSNTVWKSPDHLDQIVVPYTDILNNGGGFITIRASDGHVVARDGSDGGMATGNASFLWRYNGATQNAIATANGGAGVGDGKSGDNLFWTWNGNYQSALMTINANGFVVPFLNTSATAVGSSESVAFPDVFTRLTTARGDLVFYRDSWTGGSYKGAVAIASGSTGKFLDGTISTLDPATSNNVFTTTESTGPNYTIVPNSTGDYILVNNYAYDGWKGAVTIIDANTGRAVLNDNKVMSAANTVFGLVANDYVQGVEALDNGDWAIRASSWDNGATANVGMVAIMAGSGANLGKIKLDGSLAISSSNSYMGERADDQVGTWDGGIRAISNGRVLIGSHQYDSATISNVGRLSIYGLQTVVTDPNTMTYGTIPTDDKSLRSSMLTDVLNTGASVTMQANNDITINSAITVDNTGGNGGVLTLQAGRSILINANITTDNGNLVLIGNDTLANGVVDANRTAGAAAITMASGTSINAGTGSLSITLSTGAGLTNSTSGDITLRSVTGGAVTIVNNGATAGSEVILQGAVSASSLGVTATGGVTSTSGALGVTGNSTFTGGSGTTITVDNAGNNFGGTVTFSAISGTLGSATVVDTTALALGAMSLTGNLVVTAGGAITQTGAFDIDGTSSFTAGANAITLTNTSNDFTGAVTLSNSGANNVAVTDSNAIVLGTSSVGSGTLAVTGVGITQNGAITQAAGAGAASFSGGAGVITLTQSNNFTGAVNLSNSGANNVAVTDANAIVLGTVSIGQNLAVVSNGAITQNNALILGGASSFNAGAGTITLSLNNDFTGAVSLSNTGANLVSVTDINAIQLGTVSVGNGGLDVTAVGITQDATSVAVTGQTWIHAGTGSITLNDADNNFGAAVTIDVSTGGASNVALRDIDSIILNAATLGTGTLTVTTGIGGSITQSGAITQAAGAGAVSFVALGGNITMNHASNDFTGAVSLTGNGNAALQLRDSNAVVLGTSSLGTGTLVVTAGGTITQSGALTQGAGAGTATFNAGANAITLTNTGNDFTGGVILTATGSNNASVVDANALALGASTVGGNLNATAGTDITNTGNLAITGNSVFTAGNGGSITVNSAGNAFTGTVQFAASSGSLANVTVRDTTAFDFIALNLTGNLGAIAGGAITQSGALDIDGASSFNAGANAVTLTNTGNDFTGSVAVTNSGANNVAVTDSNAIFLGSFSVGTGTLAVNAVGITQGSTITQASGAGSATFNGGAGAITLTQNNDFTGAVSLNNSGANNVAVTDANAIVLGASSVGTGTFAVNSTGAISQTGAIVQAAGAGTASFAAGAGSITLTNAGNTFTGAVGLSNSGGNNVAVTDSGSMDLGTVSVGTGTLTVNGAGITQSGVITQTAGAGAATFNAGANSIVLTNASNNFTGAVGLNTTGNNNASVVDAGAINLGTSSVGGNLNVTATAAGDITNTGGNLSVTGNSLFTAASGRSITVNGAGNAFTGTVQFAASAGTLGSVTVVDTTALDLQALTLTGALSATGVGLTQSGVLDIDGTSSFTAGANTITLTNASNDFTGAVSLSNTGNNTVSVRDTNALVLGASTVGGDLTLQAAGAVTQTAGITVGGGLSVTTTHAAGDVVINNTGATATVLGNTLVQGDYTLTATGDAVTQANGTTIKVNGAFSATAGSVSLTGTDNVWGGSWAAGSDQQLQYIGVATLGNMNYAGNLIVISKASGETFTGAAVHGAAVTLGNAANNIAGAISITTPITNGITAAGADVATGITQTAGTTITVGGIATFSVGASTVSRGNITLVGAGSNNFGTLQLSNGGATNATVTDTNGIILGASTLGSGTLTVNAVGITQTGAITQAAGAGAATFNGGAGVITLTHAGNDFTGAVSLSNSGANAVQVTDANAIQLGTVNVGQNLTVNAVGITQDTTSLTVAGASSFNGGAGAITLTDADNNFTGAVTLANSGSNDVAVTDSNALTVATASVGKDLTLTSTGAMALGSTGAVTVAGNLVAASNGGAISQTNQLAVTGTSGFNAGANTITLTHASNNFTGAVSLSNSGANAVSVRDANALVLGTVSLGGTFGITVGGALTQTGSAVVSGATTISAGTQAVTLNHASNQWGDLILTGGAVEVRDSGAMNFGNVNVASLVARAGGAITQTGGTSIATTGAASFNTSDAAGIGSVSVTDSAAFDLATSTIGGNLLINSTGNVRQAADQTLSLVGNLNALPGGGGEVHLLGTVRLGGTKTITNNTTVIDAGANLNLNELTLPGAGDITINLTSDAVASFDGAAIAPAAVTLTNAGNTFGGAVGFTTASANYTGTTAPNTYNISQTAAVTLGAGQKLYITDKGGTNGTRGNITLNQAGNSFNNVDFSGGNISWKETGAVTILGAHASGTLSVTSTGAITDSGAVIAGGLATFNSGTNAITLDSGFSAGSVSITGGAVSITEINSTAIAGVNATAFTLTSGGAVTQTGAMVVSGTTTVTANGGTSDITLNNSGNDFATISTTGANIALRDTNAVVLGATTAGGTLTVTSGGAVTQTGDLAVTGVTTLVAGANDITLTRTGNNFSSVSVTSGKNVSLRDTDALDLGASTVTGNLTATAGGAISDSGVLAVTGNAVLKTLNDGGSDIVLDGASIYGSLSASTRNAADNATVSAAVTLNENDAMNIKSIVTGGALTLTSNGAMTQSGAMAAGASSFSAGSNAISLDHAGNVLGAVSFGGTPSAVILTENSAITQSAGWNLGSSNLTLDSQGNAITLVTAGNVFGTLVFNNAGAVNISEADAMVLGNSNSSSTVALTSTAGITGGTVVAGTSLSLTAGGSIGTGTGSRFSAETKSFTATTGSSGGAIYIQNAADQSPDTPALITGLTTVGGVINILHNGNDGLTVSGNVTSGDSSATGADITINSQAGRITVNAGVTISSQNAGSGGSIQTVGTFTQNGTLTAGDGTTVRIEGTAAGSDMDSNIAGVQNANSHSITSLRDIIITGTLNATAGNISITADSDNTGTGGVEIQAAAALSATGNISIAGSDLWKTPGTVGDAVVIAADGANNQVLATGTITIGVGSGAGIGADLDIAGRVISSGVGNISLTANDQISLGTVVQSAGGAIAFNGKTNLTANSQVTTGGGNASFSKVVDGGFSLTVNSGAGSVSFSDAVGGSAALTALDTTGGTIGLKAVTTSGAQSYTGATTLGGTLSVTGAGAGVTVTGATTLASGGGTISLTGSHADNDVTLGAVDGAQVLSITANGGDVTLGAVGGSTVLTGVSVTGNTIALTSARTSGSQDYTGTTTLSGNLATDLGANAGSITVTGNLLLGVASVTLDTDHATGTDGSIVVTGNVTGGGKALALTAGSGNVTMGGMVGSGVAGRLSSLSVTSTHESGITQVGGWFTVGTATLDAGSADISLDNAANDFGTVAVTRGGHVKLADMSGIILTNPGSTSPLSSLTVNATTITLDGARTAGAQEYTGDVTASGDLLADLGSNGGNVKITGALALGGNLRIDTDHATGTDGDISVTGNITGSGFGLTLDAGSGDITLGGTVGATGAGRLSAISVASTHASGIAQAGAWFTTGTLTVLSGTADTTLTSLLNEFGSLAVTSAKNFTLKNSGVLALGGVTVSGDLDLVSVGDMTSTGVLTVSGGLAKFDAGTGKLMLDKAGNNFKEVTVTKAGQTKIVDKDDITLAGIWATTGETIVEALGKVTAKSGAKINATGSFTASGTGFANESDAGLFASAGRWLIYSPLKSAVTKNGLTGEEDFSKLYPASPAFGGNGFVYGDAKPPEPSTNDKKVGGFTPKEIGGKPASSGGFGVVDFPVVGGGDDDDSGGGGGSGGSGGSGGGGGGGTPRFVKENTGGGFEDVGFKFLSTLGGGSGGGGGGLGSGGGSLGASTIMGGSGASSPGMGGGGPGIVVGGSFAGGSIFASSGGSSNGGGASGGEVASAGGGTGFALGFGVGSLAFDSRTFDGEVRGEGTNLPFATLSHASSFEILMEEKK